MAPGIPNEAGGLGWSKYAPTIQNDGLAKGGLNKRTAESIARQAKLMLVYPSFVRVAIP